MTRLLATFLLLPFAALADDEPERTDPLASKAFRLGGYAEASYQWNFNQPSNGLTNFRGFDHRHNTFLLQNVAVDAQWDVEDVVGRVTLQVGSTPASYYAGEATLAGTSSVSGSAPFLWQYVQQAYVGYRFGLGGGLTVSAGLFLSPIGPESMAIHEDWAWSRSNLFFGLPFYHLGVKASYALTERWTLTVMASNGWNSIVDANDGKSVMVQAVYAREGLTASVLYFGGVERPRGAPEGQPWRSLFDAHVTWQLSPRIALLAHGNTGFEVTRFGLDAWQAGALAARVELFPFLFLAARGDVVLEQAPTAAARILFPSPWLSSGTATLELKPHARVSFRLEYRHDQAGAPLYFAHAVAGDGTLVAWVPNATSQDTLTLGATTWF